MQASRVEAVVASFEYRLTSTAVFVESLCPTLQSQADRTPILQQDSSPPHSNPPLLIAATNPQMEFPASVLAIQQQI
jgi:hypothetical protein